MSTYYLSCLLLRNHNGLPRFSLRSFLRRNFRTSCNLRGLDEFFDHKDNWKETDVPVGWCTIMCKDLRVYYQFVCGNIQ